MNVLAHLASENEHKMFRYIQHQYGTTREVNADAKTIFFAIQNLFDGLEGKVVIDAYLIHNLAACAWVALEYDRSQDIPMDESEHDSVLVRTFRGLLQTLATAIQNRLTREIKDETYYGQFHIPDWYVKECKRFMQC